MEPLVTKNQTSPGEAGKTKNKIMNATNKIGHVWTGDGDGQWWIYEDENGHEYESKEIPAYRIVMDNAAMTDHGILPKEIA